MFQNLVKRRACTHGARMEGSRLKIWRAAEVEVFGGGQEVGDRELYIRRNGLLCSDSVVLFRRDRSWCMK